MSTHDRDLTNAPPLVGFDPSGRAPLLSYNVPEPTSYAGRTFVEFDVDPDWFRSEAREGTTYEEWLEEFLKPPVDFPHPIDDIGDPGHEDEEELHEDVEDKEELHEDVEDEEGVHEDVVNVLDTDRRARLNRFAGVVESMFQDGDSGPVVGATDRRVRESVAAVGNAAKLVKAPAFVGGTTILGGEGPESTDALHSTVTSALKPNLFVTTPLSRSGSGTAPMAAEALAQSAKEHDVEVSVLRSIQPSTVAREAIDGRVPVARYTMGGRPTVSYATAPQTIHPQLVLVERYQLSTFLGSYGAGRTVETFSLLPGEATTISVKTFRKIAEERQEASSILDSYTRETAEEFEEHVSAEQSNTEEHERSFAYQAEAKAEAKWGWGRASVSGGVQGGTNAARQESAKNISTATSKHAAEASTKRDVQIDTNYEVSEEAGEETSIERQLENINLSRTLNFVFRQMNQEFITLLHLVDVRVGFTNGGVEVRPGTGSLAGVSYREVSLPDLDDLLEDVIVADRRKQVREFIEGELSSVFDYRGERRSIVEHVELPGADGEDGRYLRVDPTLRTTYTDESGSEITVPGVVVSADTNVMRTEGIVVEALLGGGEALDDYSQGLQGEEVRKRSLENEERGTLVDRERLAQSLVGDGDDGAVDRFERLFARERDEPADPKPEPQPDRGRP